MKKSKYLEKTNWKTNGFGEIIVLEKEIGKNSFKIMFKEDGTVLKNVFGSQIGKGEIKNPNSKTVYNIGYKGQINGEVVYDYKKNKKEYQLWFRMFQRCYCEKLHESRPTYIGCKVCERWHNFQNFCEDLPKLENYNFWKKSEIKREWHLDKDIKIKGNKIYSFETCKFSYYVENCGFRAD